MPTGCEVPSRGIVEHGPRSGSKVSLTFDEPLGRETRPILRILRRHRAKATFFQVGEQMKDDPGLTRRIVREGHEIGNHSFSHRNMTELSGRQIRREIARTQAVAKRVGGFEPCLFRAPSGAHDERLARVLGKAGTPLIFWDLAAVEWVFSPERIVARLVPSIRPGSIVLFHQVASARLALGPILDAMEAQGLRSVPVTRLLGGRFLRRPATTRKRRPWRRNRRCRGSRKRGRAACGRRNPVISVADGRNRSREHRYDDLP